MQVSFSVIIPAAGVGSRFKGDKPKQYQTLFNKSVLEWSLDLFEQFAVIKQVILVVAKDDLFAMDYPAKYSKLKLSYRGGISRAESVKNALNELNLNSEDWVLVHDAARPLLTKTSLFNLITSLKLDFVGGVLANLATDTVKLVELEDNTITKTLNRAQVFLAQTPQMFRYGVLTKALAKANLELVTDEASAVEALGLKVKIVLNSEANFKITYPQDLALAEVVLKSRERI